MNIMKRVPRLKRKAAVKLYSPVNFIMRIVFLCALGVGGATVLGAIFGFFFKGIGHRAQDAVLSFAAGVSIASAVLGLILPSLEFSGDMGIIVCILGIFSGAFCVCLLDKAVPFARKFLGLGGSQGTERITRILIFVMAVAIHNLPEGLAAGVGFGSGDEEMGFFIALGIAIQNIPEGMIVIAPMLSAGVSPKKTFLTALFTGLVEVVGTIAGYYAARVAAVILPFSLSLAGGTMIYVASHDMIPETHSHGNEQAASYSLIAGFCLMLFISRVL